VLGAIFTFTGSFCRMTVPFVTSFLRSFPGMFVMAGLFALLLMTPFFSPWTAVSSPDPA
jgi:hypothetical protein